MSVRPGSEAARSELPVPTGEAAGAVPGAGSDRLYVDLDDVLVATRCGWEAWLQRFRRLRSGAASAPAEAPADLDAAALPYRHDLLRQLETARDAGQARVLVASGDPRWARAVADHLGLFDAVLVPPAAGRAARREAVRADAAGRSHRHLEQPPGAGSSAAAALRALRPHQWIKNALLFAPIALAHELGDSRRLAAVAIAFAAFCCVASATYLVNDLLDLDADRRHPRKRHRPLASGALPIPHALLLAPGLLGIGVLASAALLPGPATGLLVGYAVLTSAYSLLLKEWLFVDVLVLAGLYTLRVVAGAAAAQVPVSPWLLAFSTFFFLSLAFLKRYAELLGAQARDEARLAGRSYEVRDTGLVETMGSASGYISVLVLCLYVSGSEVGRLYRTPELLWGMCPVMLFWITRIWFLARRGQVADDPVLFAATDRASWVSAALIAGVVALAAAGA